MLLQGGGMEIKMKKKMVVLLIAAGIASGIGASAAECENAAETPRIGYVQSAGVQETVKGKAERIVVGLEKKEIDVSDLPSAPYYVGDTLMVPLRRISEALGYSVGWNEETGEITVDDEYIQSAVLRENSRKAVFMGRLKVIDMSREIENAKETVIMDGCTYVPSEFFREFLNDVEVSGNTVSVSPSMAQIQGKTER